MPSTLPSVRSNGKPLVSPSSYCRTPAAKLMISFKVKLVETCEKTSSIIFA